MTTKPNYNIDSERYMKTMNQNGSCVKIKYEDMENGTDFELNNYFSKRFVVENNLPQIAIDKYDDSMCERETEVVLLNGNWDTSHTIPSLVAEMHSIKAEQMNAAGFAGPADAIPNGWSTDPLRLRPEDHMVPSTAASPRGSDSGLGCDSPEGNLSWLLNFRLEDIPGLPDLSQGTTPTTRRSQDGHCKVYIAETIPKQYFDQHQVQNVNVKRIIHDQQQPCPGGRDDCGNHGPPGTTTQGSRGSVAPLRGAGARKPPFTYTELIEHALREKGELTVSGIYQWISDHFSFYKANDDRWKNSVRHNLSINPHFRKGSKAVHGAGHLWTIAQKDDHRNTTSWNAKKQRMQQFMQTTASEWHQERQQELELAAATASILPEADNYDNSIIIENRPKNLMHQTAQEILGGVKREVEVEYIIPVNNSMDFMCPVSKEQVAEECGLHSDELDPYGSNYLITDINPTTLGLNLTEAEIITSDQLFSEDLNLCYELTSDH